MKILILTASPIRDKIIDEMIADNLISKGHEVWVRPCLREGRKSVLEIQPDVCVVPPIRNLYSRDFAEQLKKWNIGVISRHTEPSCDWQDFKKMTQPQKSTILGHFAYFVDMELVWSKDEAEILNRRPANFKAFPIGSVTCDPFFIPDKIKEYQNKTLFNKKFGFSNRKKTLLIASPWGFADSAPDLNIDDFEFAQKDNEGREKHFEMIRVLKKELGEKWNILLSVHPNVLIEPYKELSKELDIPLDTESISFYLLVNSDALIHAGSTMSINAHLLNYPAYQYGDVNCKDSKNWWGMPESSISKVSPYFNKSQKLVKAIKNYRKRSNANKKILDVLEQGRYGLMDGKATERAAELICKVSGKFKMCWPDNTKDYSQLTILRNPDRIVNNIHCGICGNTFSVVREDWLKTLEKNINKKVEIKYENCCPYCGSKFFKKFA